MHERSLEILVRHCVESIFDVGWNLIAQQLTLPSGRIDLLFSDGLHQRQVVELKKGRAKKEAVHQVLRYAVDLSDLLDGTSVSPWVLAHEIPNDVEAYASSVGVRTRAVSVAECEELVKAYGLSEKDLLGIRRAEGVLHGGSGGGGVWRSVPNAEAYLEMPHQMAALLRSFETQDHFILRSGAMQTVIHYRGVKLGGVNRKHGGGHGYISEGVVLRHDTALLLERLGFSRKTKIQAGSDHEHIWWQLPIQEADSFGKAIHHAVDVVDRSLGIAEPCRGPCPYCAPSGN